MRSRCLSSLPVKCLESWGATEEKETRPWGIRAGNRVRVSGRGQGGEGQGESEPVRVTVSRWDGGSEATGWGRGLPWRSGNWRAARNPAL